jgi:hypothetical protein
MAFEFVEVEGRKEHTYLPLKLCGSRYDVSLGDSSILVEYAGRKDARTEHRNLLASDGNKIPRHRIAPD